jgi:hypothetical protein
MAVRYEKRTCDFCMAQSEIEEPEVLEDAGWTEVDDVEGTMDRCPVCTLAGDDGLVA